jgi:hypothetical protein
MAILSVARGVIDDLDSREDSVDWENAGPVKKRGMYVLPNFLDPRFQTVKPWESAVFSNLVEGY